MKNAEAIQALLDGKNIEYRLHRYEPYYLWVSTCEFHPLQDNELVWRVVTEGAALDEKLAIDNNIRNMFIESYIQSEVTGDHFTHTEMYKRAWLECKKYFNVEGEQDTKIEILNADTNKILFTDDSGEVNTFPLGANHEKR